MRQQSEPTTDPVQQAVAFFDEALSELEWSGADFCARVGVVPNTVWRWRKRSIPIPQWVGEYLRALLALHRLHAEFVAPRRLDVSANDRPVVGAEKVASNNQNKVGE